MGWWSERVVPRLTDRSLSTRPVMELRQEARRVLRPHLTRDVPALLTEAGQRLDRVEQAYLPGPAISKPWGFGPLAVASKA